MTGIAGTLVAAAGYVRCGRLWLVKVVFDSELWLWDARRADTWVFATLPAEASQEIRDLAGGLRRGFGSLRVRATIGGSTWRTSIFPDATAGYVLPVKRPVRAAEGLDVGDTATVTVELLDFTVLPRSYHAAEEPDGRDRLIYLMS